MATPAHGVILAAGSGTRMPPLVDAAHPKALLTIANRPMLFYSLRALLSANITDVTVVVPPAFRDPVLAYVTTHFPADPAAAALPKPNLTLLDADANWGTADALRNVVPSAPDLVVMSSDYVGDLALSDIVAHHTATQSTATAALVACKPPPPQPNPKAKKPAKKKQPTPDFSVDHYALLASDNTLHGLYRPSDLSANHLRLPASLVVRHASLRVRSDLADPHVYVLDAAAVAAVLEAYPAISSVRFDLVPYLARRQATLSRRAVAPDAVSVSAYIADGFALRANTVAAFLRANLEVAGDALPGLRAESDAEKPEKGKKGKRPERKLPFASHGERVSVADSLVADGVTAGDKVSVKKSVVGRNVSLAAGVKINSCVLLADVRLAEDVNLSGCILCEGAVVGTAAVLKDCRVAAGVSVPEGTQSTGTDFAGGGDNVFGLGEDIEFC